jgi:DNA-binding NarL/FixJ family response regulator
MLARKIGAALTADGLRVLRERPAEQAVADAVVVVLRAVDEVGRDLVAALRSRTAGVALVVVVPNADHAAVRRLLDVGVDAVVDEAEAGRALASAVRAACCGQLTLPRTYRERFGRPTLTRREKQVLGLVVMGLSNAEIARRLHLSQSTVKCHLTSSFAKLGARSRNEATALILDPVRGFGLGVLALTPRADAGDVG